MTWLYELVQRRWQSLLLLLLAAGFAGITLDLLRAGHVEGTQFLGVVASGVAFVCVLIGLLAGRTMRGAMAVVLLFVALAGLLGAWLHLEQGLRGPGGRVPAYLVQERALQTVRYAPSAVRQEGGGLSLPRASSEGGPSPLLPLVISGLALMAAILLLVPGSRRR